MDLKSKVSPKETVKVEVKPEVVTLFIDNTPSNWVIVPDGDNIIANNVFTLETFKGTMSEFNRRLRG